MEQRHIFLVRQEEAKIHVKSAIVSMENGNAAGHPSVNNRSHKAVLLL